MVSADVYLIHAQHFTSLLQNDLLLLSLTVAFYAVPILSIKEPSFIGGSKSLRYRY